MSKRSRRAAAAATGSTGAAAGAGSTGRVGSGPSRTPPSAGRASSPSASTSASTAASGAGAGRSTTGAGGGPRRGSQGEGGSYVASGASRAGRRARVVYTERSFMERHRSQILIVGGIIAAVIFGGLIFIGSTSPAYACSLQLDPATPSPSAAASASPVLGQIEDDMGRTHVTVGTSVHYTFCPPASGEHFNAQGEGPIPPRFYGPDDVALPMGWIHNLEHGALVVLYNCNLNGCNQADQDQLRALATNLPNSPICNIPGGLLSPVIARFDQMKAPFAAVIWGRVMFQDKLNVPQILEFFKQYGETTNPEKQCSSPSPGASGSPVTTGNPAAPETSGPPAVVPAPTASPSGT